MDAMSEMNGTNVVAWRQEEDVPAFAHALDGQIELPTALLPAFCPLCGAHSLHFYIYAPERKTTGTGWIWCSTCWAFSHARWRVPIWWSNSPLFPLDELRFAPGKLEELSDKVDEHWNALAASLKTQR
jgi:hypothetical protein